MAGEIHTAISSPSDKSLWNETPVNILCEEVTFVFLPHKVIVGPESRRKQLPEPMVNPIYCGRWI